MKLLLSLLSLIVICATVKSQFINFIGTYSGESNNQCNTAISGVGYSIKAGICVSNIANFQTGIAWGPNNYNFLLNINSNKDVVITQYTTWQNAACDEIIETSKLNLNQCGTTPNFQGINVTSLTSVTTSSTPQYQSGTLVIEQYNYYGNHSKCNDGTLLYATTYTNGYSFQDNENSTTITYSCNNGVPFAKNCDYTGACKIDKIAANCDQQVQQIIYCQK